MSIHILRFIVLLIKILGPEKKIHWKRHVVAWLPTTSVSAAFHLKMAPMTRFENSLQIPSFCQHTVFDFDNDQFVIWKCDYYYFCYWLTLNQHMRSQDVFGEFVIILFHQ